MHIKDYIENNDSSATEDFLEDVIEEQDELEKLEDLELEALEQDTKETQELFINNIKLPKRWLYEHLLYRDTINILDGLGSQGKSTLALQLAINTIVQKPFLLPCFEFWKQEQCTDLEYSKVMYLTTKTENPPEIVMDKIVAICNELNIDKNEVMQHLYIPYKTAKSLLKENGKGVEPTDFYEPLKKFIKKHNIELLIIDPLVRFLGCEENNNKNISIFYDHLEKLDTTILLIHHQPKTSITAKADATTARGASALRENARCRLVLKDNVLLIEKNNLSIYQGHEIPMEVRNYTYSTNYKEPFKKGEIRETIDITAVKKGGNGNEKEKLA